MTLAAARIPSFLSVVLQLVLAIILTVFCGTFLLAAITATHQTIRCKISQATHPSNMTTAVYVGRVSHTRFQPVKHCFSYPLFFCLLDLSEVKGLFKGHIPLMWPLNYLINFRDSDHLKNGEGKISSGAIDPRSHAGDTLSPRIRQLVRERTKGKFVPSEDQKILLLTHLCYFGYCFNPVSFYYILKKGASLSNTGDNIEAIVAEVSNTPWNEMKCYVLHPDSEDMLVVKEGKSRNIDVTNWTNAKEGEEAEQDGDDSASGEWKAKNYIFQKAFHVSPFMDMAHYYDWTFWSILESRIMASTTMRKPKGESLKRTDLVDKDESDNSKVMKDTVTYFNAFFDIERASFNSFRLCYQLVRFPVYCFIIQIWIHIEAFNLFVKGVEFIPHPEASETAASKIIAKVMIPFFAFKDWIASRNNSSDHLKTD